MADEAASDVFHAHITAVDESSATIDAIRKMFQKLAHEAEHVGHATEHMHKPHIWAELGEHINLTREHFGELHASVGEVGAGITELLPAMAALGAGAGLVALFETAERTAEAFGEMSHRAESLGMSVQQLQRLNIVAKLTDTNSEAMAKSMGHLNRVIAEAAGGKNKEVAATFARLGIHLYDNNHHLRSANDLLPQLADAFQKTGSIAGKTAGAFALFGKGGIDMIPFMSKGAEVGGEKLTEAGKLGFDFEPHAENLEHYNEAMKKLSVSTEALSQEIGAKLSPVLQPIVDKTQHWVDVNRDWIATGIADQVGNLADWLQKLPLDDIAHGFEVVGGRVGYFVQALGGAKTAVEVLSGVMALKTVMFLANPILALGSFSIGLGKATYAVGTTLAEAWGGVEVAAGAAAAAEHGAAAAGAEAAAASAKGMAGLVGLAEKITRIAFPLTGAFAAHNADADDHVGQFVDRNVPGAAAVDAWFYRKTGGIVGHPMGWVEKLDSAERGREDIASRRFVVPSTTLPVPRRADQPMRAADVGFRNFAGPVLADAGPMSPDPFLNSLFAGAPTLAPAPLPSGNANGSGRLQGGVDINLKISGLPPGATVDTDTNTSGIARTPMVSWDASTGQAFADRHGKR